MTRWTGGQVDRWTGTANGEAVLLALVTPLLEKNIVKTFGLDAPFVVSMSRVIVLAFAIGELRQMWRAGIAGWPEATLAIAIVLALPLLGAIERARPADVMELAKTLVSRFGVGGVRPMASVYARAGAVEVRRSQGGRIGASNRRGEI